MTRSLEKIILDGKDQSHFYVLDFHSAFLLNGSVKLIPKVNLMILTLRKVGFILFPITIIGIFLDQWLTARLELELMSESGASDWVWMWGVLSMVLNLFYPLLLLLAVLAVLSRKEVSSFAKKNFSSVLREQMRAWGHVVWWSLLFAVPGVIKFLQYFFVPFIVCFSETYEAGGQDVLLESKKLVKRVWLRLLGWIFLFTIAIPLLLSSFEEYKVFADHPLSAIFFVAVEVILNVVFIVLVFDLFQRSFLNESHVSVERS